MSTGNDPGQPSSGVDLMFRGSEFDGLKVHLSDLTAQDVLEARRSVDAGQTDAAPVRRLQEALLGALYPPGDAWGPGDDAALLLEASDLRGGECV